MTVDWRSARHQKEQQELDGRDVARGWIQDPQPQGARCSAGDIPAIDGLRVNNVQTAAYPRRTLGGFRGVEGHLALIFDQKTENAATPPPLPPPTFASHHNFTAWQALKAFIMYMLQSPFLTFRLASYWSLSEINVYQFKNKC